MKRGDIIKCIAQDQSFSYGVSMGKEYVVNSVEAHHNATYVKVIGDDDKAHVLLCSLFAPT